MNDSVQDTTDGGDLLAQMVAHERRTAERIRKGAMLAWGAVFAGVPVLGIAVYLERNAGGQFIEVVRALSLVTVIGGALALVLAVLLTVAWTFRARAPTLAAIEHRLATLEQLLGPRKN